MTTREIIKTQREKLGLTQKELADRLNLHVQSISNVERGVSPLPNKYLLYVIKLLEIDEEAFIDQLMEEQKNKFIKDLRSIEK